MSRRIRVELGGCGSLVSGHGSYDLLVEAGGRPVWVGRLRGFSCQERRARDVIAICEARGWSVEVIGPRTRRQRALEALMAAPAPVWPPVEFEAPDGLWSA